MTSQADDVQDNIKYDKEGNRVVGVTAEEKEMLWNGLDEYLEEVRPFKQVMGWQATDGSMFPTRDEALQYSLSTQFREWYKTHGLCHTSHGSRGIASLKVPDISVEKWIFENREFLKGFLFEEVEETCRERT